MRRSETAVRVDAMRPSAPDLRVASIRTTLTAAFGPGGPPNLHPNLLVPESPGWIRAADVVSGARLPELIAAVRRKLRASPHAAAAMAWKSYSYALALPVVAGWAASRRVPLVDPSVVMVRVQDPRPLLRLGLRPAVRIAVLPADPLADAGDPAVEVVADEVALLGALRIALLDAHLRPLMAWLQRSAHVGARNLLGSLASSVATGVLRTGKALPSPAEEHIATLLATLGVQDLVELVPGPSGTPTVQRKTCCLAFTLPEPRICAGCCIRTGRRPP